MQAYAALFKMQSLKASISSLEFKIENLLKILYHDTCI